MLNHTFGPEPRNCLTDRQILIYYNFNSLTKYYCINNIQVTRLLNYYRIIQSQHYHITSQKKKKKKSIRGDDRSNEAHGLEREEKRRERKREDRIS